MERRATSGMSRRSRSDSSDTGDNVGAAEFADLVAQSAMLRRQGKVEHGQNLLALGSMVKFLQLAGSFNLMRLVWS